ncbi:hypothetical protein CapIbe_012555 [Capra ibex]
MLVMSESRVNARRGGRREGSQIRRPVAAFPFRTWTRRDGSPTAEGAGLVPRKRRAYPGGTILRVDRIESSKEPEAVPSTSGSVSLLACSLDASPCMPAVILYYWTLQAHSHLSLSGLRRVRMDMRNQLRRLLPDNGGLSEDGEKETYPRDIWSFAKVLPKQ